MAEPDWSRHMGWLRGAPSNGLAGWLADRYELGLRVAVDLDDENNCQDCWSPCWCRSCHPALY